MRAAFPVGLAGLFLVVTTGGVAHARPDPPARNAALYYWQAFACLPDEAKLTTTERKRVEEEWETGPLDADTEAALKKYADALVYLHRGAAIPGCAWASELDLPRDGIGTRVPQLARSGVICRAALLRARYRFAHNQPRRATDDLLALVRFARHLQTGGTLVGMLLSYGIERDLIRVAAANVWSLSADREALAAFRTAWDKLPPSRPMTDALLAERDGIVGMLRHHARLDPSDVPDDEFAPIGFVPTLKFILGWETRDEAINTLCTTVGKNHERLTHATDVTPKDVKAAEKAFFDTWQRDTAGDDPVSVVWAKTLLPATGRLRLTEAELQTRRAMLRAVLAVAEKGTDEFKKHAEPFGTKPFAVRLMPGGYELEPVMNLGGPVL